MATVYPFDPSGTSAVNRVPNEQHVITAQNFRDYHYVIPNFAPFFEDNFTIRLQYPSGATRDLIEGVDYYLSNQFLDASKACAKPIYGSISFLDTDTAGILSITYNTVGGEWNITAAEITRILAEEMRNPRITTWEQITNLPERFPVVDHEWDLVDMVGASSVVSSIDNLRAAVLSANGGGLAAHIADKSNPHNTTKAQVGLSDVLNYGVATQQDAQAGTSNILYMTPLSTAQAINVIGGAQLQVHILDSNNPHNVTKAQVGLSNVSNYPLATQAQAETGATDTAYMTPLKTNQAITAQVGTVALAHIANTQNPHNVTATQVGLFNVQNYPIASQQIARAGTDNASYMTPLRTAQYTADYVATTLAVHTSRTDNPHATTAAQVGAYSTDQVNAMLTSYVRRNDQWVSGMSTDDFIAHVLSGTAANASEFGGLTPSQYLDSVTAAQTNLFAHMSYKYSRDQRATPDPVATPNRWIKLGSVTILSNTQTGSVNSMTVSNPDSYWLFSGGHKQAAQQSDNAKATSPVYMIHAKNGLGADAHTFEVTRLNGSADTDVVFGYTFDTTSSTLNIWAKVGYAYNDINVTRMTSLGNTQVFSDDSTVVEPTGIVYATAVSYATNAALTILANRVTALENKVNGTA